MADCVVTENADGTVDYDFTIRDDVKFADGEPLTIDDVIFSYYAYLDPSYDGSSSLYALPIKGLDAYRNGSTVLYQLMLDKGADNTISHIIQRMNRRSSSRQIFRQQVRLLQRALLIIVQHQVM